MKEVEEDILLFLENSGGEPKGAEYIKTKLRTSYGYESDEVDDALDNLTSGETKLLKTNSDGKFKLRRNAQPITASIRNSRVNRSLLDFQRKSSSIETLFTFSIILFSMIQALRLLDNSKIPFSEHNIALVVLGVGGLILILALDVGKENLIKTLKEETWLGSFRHKAQWLNAIEGLLWGVFISIVIYVVTIVLSAFEASFFGTFIIAEIVKEYGLYVSAVITLVLSLINTTKLRFLPERL